MTQAPANTYDALLDAAEELFSERGYTGVGIREIVDRAGANIAAINYHFGSKQGLYLATVQRAMQQRVTSAAWEALEGRPADANEAAAALARFIDRFLRHLIPADRDDAASCFILREAAQPSEAIDSILENFIKPNEALLVQTLQVLAPQCSRAQLSLYAQSVLGQMLHYRTFRPFLERMPIGDLSNTETIAAIAEHITRFSLQGLRVEPTTIDQAISAARSDRPTASCAHSDGSGRTAGEGECAGKEEITKSCD
jgi:AcrR family transcriptional regulator